MKNTAIRGLENTQRLGMIGKLNNSLNAFKNLNWTNFINNTSKTLNIINQTIPVIKQAKPMINNIKSMLKIASIFKDETDKIHPQNNKKTNIQNNQTKPSNKNPSTKKEEDYSPTFFITT